MAKPQVAKVSSYPTVGFFKNGRSIEYKPPKDGGALSALHIANTAFRKAKAFLKGAYQPKITDGYAEGRDRR